jgi:hypothetical protein
MRIPAGDIVGSFSFPFLSAGGIYLDMILQRVINFLALY